METKRIVGMESDRATQRRQDGSESGKANERNVNYALYGVIFLIYVYVARIQELFAFLTPLHIGKIAVGIAILLYLAGYRKTKQSRGLLKNSQIRCIVGIIAFSVLSIPFSVWPANSFRFVTNSLPKTYIFFFLLVNVISSLSDLKRVLWAFSICGFMLSVFNLAEGGLGRIAVTGTYDPNDLAFVIVMILPIVFYLFHANTGVKKVFLLTTMGCLLLAFIQTSSRGGFLGLSAVAMFILFREKRIKFSKKMGLIAIGIILMLSFAPSGFWERMSTITSFSEDYNFTRVGGRKEVWKRGLKIMMENPLLGVGAGSFEIAEGMSHEDVGGKWSAAHNSFIDIGATLGLISLLLFARMIWSSYRDMNRLSRSGEFGQYDDFVWISRAICGGLVGFCVCGFFLSQAWSSSMYLLVGLSISTSHLVKRAALQAKESETGSPRVGRMTRAARES